MPTHRGRGGPTVDLEHIEAIAHHNAGEVQLRIGRVEEAVASLERAAAFWSEAPTSPFADNSELVKALVMGGHYRKGQGRRDRGTSAGPSPWTRSNADAAGGLAAVLMADGNFGEAHRGPRWSAQGSSRVGIGGDPVLATQHDGCALPRRGRTRRSWSRRRQRMARRKTRLTISR